MARAGKSGPLFEVRKSKVHGKGAFALQGIAKGTRITEYLGERVSHEEADRRYESKDATDNHTFLFIVDDATVIDAGVDGNDARFFNHSCDPNCEAVVEDGRVFIEAIRDIEPGEEMSYDYHIVREDSDPPDIDVIFACRCGAATCRGTMLWPPKRSRRRKAARKRHTVAKKAVAKTAAGKRSNATARSEARFRARRR